jgi:energy-coupling factor transporter ATP-binding protein EcfA2
MISRIGFYVRDLLIRGVDFFFRVFLGQSTGAEAFSALRRVCIAERKLFGILKAVRPQVASRLLFSGLSGSPVYYLRWAVLGLVVAVMLALRLQLSDSIVFGLSPSTWLLDLSIGLLIGLSAARESLRDMGRHALTEAEEATIGKISNEIHSRLEVPSPLQSQTEAMYELAELQQQLRERDYNAKAFGRNGWTVTENLYNLLLVLSVIVLISPLGALFALFATITIIPSIVYELIALQRSEMGLIVDRARRRSLLRISEDPRWKCVLRWIAPAGAIVEPLIKLSEQIGSARGQGKARRNIQREISRGVFFSLFALSCWFPIEACIKDQLSLRIALLYMFSMLGLWYAIAAIAEKSALLFEKASDLELIERALAELEKVQSTSSIVAAGPDRSELYLSFRFAYPYSDTLLRCTADGIRVPHSVDNCWSGTLAVVGRPRSGRTSLMRLLTGELYPTSGAITIGNIPTTDCVMSREAPLIPDLIPPFQQMKILELFQSFLNHPDLSVVEVEEILRKIDLLDQIKRKGSEDYTGANLLIGYRGNYLDDNQTRLLFLALQFAALKLRIKENGFRPKLILLDGAHRLTTRKQRLLVKKLFKEVAEELYATLIVVIRDPSHEIDDRDFVITLLEPQDFPPEQTLRQENGNLLTGGLHKDRWKHADKTRRERYRAFLKSVAEVH